LTSTLLRRFTPLVLLMFLLAACGTAASPSPSTPAATSAPPSGPAVDLEAAAEALEELDSYKLSLVVEGSNAATVDAVVIRNPEPARHYTTAASGTTSEIILIGDQAWIGTGGAFQSVPAAAVESSIAAFDIVLLMGQMNQPGVADAMRAEGNEEKNGAPTTHYVIDENSPGVGASFPPNGSFDLWIADDGYLVSLEALNMAPGVDRLSINITDINSSDNVVEPPD
jgi:hypothetical protein